MKIGVLILVDYLLLQIWVFIQYWKWLIDD